MAQISVKQHMPALTEQIFCDKKLKMLVNC